LIVKAADGYGGKTNFLVRTYQEFKEVLNSHRGVQFVVQEFIPNDRDYRCLVFGGKVKLVLQRSRDTASESHLNNTSQGATGEIIPLENLPVQAIADVESAALALNRSSFAGVDLLINSETGQHYILEVNQTPQVEIGAAVDQKMSALLDHMESEAGKDTHV
jgi:ribosomal protein S6--L-glutamate ligase/gamma-F420-2:alpha-L-glutamate ligase